jgi:hypothetical protein
MKKWTMCVWVSIAVMLTLGTVSAVDLGLSGKIGTLGLGADLTIGISSTLNGRVGINGLSYDMDVGGDEDEDGETSEEVQTELSWFTIAGLLDWHPFENGFRLSGGLMLNNNEIVLSADPNDLVDINDTEYAITSLTGEVSFDQMAPYLGIGYGNAVGEDGRWHFACDLGVMFQGTPQVSIKATSANPAMQASLDSDLAAETQDIEEDAEAFDMFPVLSVGVSRKF